MNDNKVTEAMVFELLQSEEAFPVDFEMAWKWIGYASKQKAKDKLTRNFERGTDYTTTWLSVAHSKGSSAPLGGADLTYSRCL